MHQFTPSFSDQKHSGSKATLNQVSTCHMTSRKKEAGVLERAEKALPSFLLALLIIVFALGYALLPAPSCYGAAASMSSVLDPVQWSNGVQLYALTGAAAELSAMALFAALAFLVAKGIGVKAGAYPVVGVITREGLESTRRMSWSSGNKY